MPEDDVSRRFEDIESKLEELEDLELTNQIEILEIKTLIEDMEPGEAVVGKGKGKKSPKGTKASHPPPKEVVKAVENLYKIVNGLERKIEKLHEEVDDLKKRKPRRRGPREREEPEHEEKEEKPPRRRAAPAGDIEVTEIRSKLDKAKEIMRRD